jgi:hypothetical protein
VHAGFYRLSEDLDFAIPMPVDASRTQRSRAADVDAKLKSVLREKEFRDFVLDRAIALVVDMAARVT